MPRAYPVLYSFRRCPYAMRARIGLYKSGIACELREVVLRHKPQSMLSLSPKGTVPVLQTIDGQVIDESLDIMLWALGQHDPGGWLAPEQGTLEDMLLLVDRSDHDFKDNLDRYKYPGRYEDTDPIDARHKAEGFIQALEEKLTASAFLFGEKPTLADFAIAPFIRQFAHVDKDWFFQTSYRATQKWLSDFLINPHFITVMGKHTPWVDGKEGVEGDDLLLFGADT